MRILEYFDVVERPSQAHFLELERLQEGTCWARDDRI
ncbi:unnamed protein product [Anisakis simplex]|uniref:Uncharacterized protein n=1 Tax=Anisakis simplex TaxID=6269 RepID=A0A3P6PA68_ANISI|nr:unnamed protein product [Anisakis simplex]